MGNKDKILDPGVLAQKLSTPEPGDCPYTLFLGAGASVSSGIPAVNRMVREWKIQLFRDGGGERRGMTNQQFSEALSAWEKTEYDVWRQRYTDSDETEYAALFSHFYQHPKERQMYIEKVVQKGRPTFGYLYLAGLIQARRFNRVLTTNFDDLLHDALTQYYQTKPIVCAFDSAVAGIRIASRRPKIIKLHGDFLYDNIKNVRHELKALDTNMEEKLYEMCKDSGLIVVGYAGRDESVMAPIRDMLRKPNYLNLGLHWCLHADGSGHLEPPEHLERLVSNHRDRVHLYQITSFDRLMESLFVRCDCRLPPVLIEPQLYNPPAQFFDAIREGSHAVLSPRMVEDLKVMVQEANRNDRTAEQYVREAELDWEMGKKARDTGDLVGAEKLFKLGLQRLESFFDGDIEAAIEAASPRGGAMALRRRAGLQIGIAKLLHSQGRHMEPEFDACLDDALANVARGIELVESERGHEIRGTLRTTFYYQGCCALGVRHAVRGELSDEDTWQVERFISAFKIADVGGEHLRKLIYGDTDFATLRERFAESER
jgi:NAD-dependent SIR2 family protein deacetylase